jgi:hypothetical protein
MHMRKTRRGKTKQLGVEKISPQEDQAGAPAVGCSREKGRWHTSKREKMNRGSTGLGSQEKGGS